MAATLRLARRGTKKRPFYHIVAADERAGRDGRFIEELGTYDPRVETDQLKVDLEAANAWVARGARVSQTVAKLLKRATAAQSAPAA